MKLVLSLILALASTGLQAAALKKAQFTRVVNDVKVLPEQQQPQAAKVGDVLVGRSSVTTGAQSRAELRFEDNSITRLGANSVFSFEQGSRNVDLKQGVMLLQVPKQLGGARVRTAAVTAAVTGTTVMVEYQANGYIKLIVLEGEANLYRNDAPSVFRTIMAGDMMIMKPDSMTIPEPVQVDLSRLKKSSKLTNDDEFGSLGNEKYLQGAESDQNKKKANGDLRPTPLLIPGLGTTLDLDRIRDLFTGITILPAIPNTPQNPPNPATTNPDGTTKFGAPKTIGGIAVLDNTTSVITDPIITTSFNGTVGRGNGVVYRPVTDGTLGQAMFGKSTLRLGADDIGSVAHLDQMLKAEGNWAAFKFDEAHLIGAPSITTTGGPTNLMLVSDTNFFLSDVDPFNPSSINTGSWDLSTSGLRNLAIVARYNIEWGSGFSVQGTDQNLFLTTQESISVDDEGSTSAGDIIMSSGSPLITLPDGKVHIHAARNFSLSGGVVVTDVPSAPPAPRAFSPQISADTVDISAEGEVTVGPNAAIAAKTSLKVRSKGNLTIQDSATLKRLSLADPLEIKLLAETGDLKLLGSGGGVEIDGSDVSIESRQGNVTIDQANIMADFLRVRTLAPNGTLMIGNSTLSATTGMHLYAEGSNGTVQFVANTTLNGPATIAANKVQVDPSVNVTVGNPNSLNVHSNVENFNRGGYGNFTNGSTPLNFVAPGTTGPHKGNFNSRPGF